MLGVALCVILFSLVIYAVRSARNINQYWKRRGLKHLEPVLFFGNTLPVELRKKHHVDVQKELCQKFPDEPLLGFYDMMSPRLIVQDAEFIEKILIKDFQHFTDHGLIVPDEERSPIEHYQLFSLTGAKWRAYRYKMSPLFTSGKLKQFYEALDTCGDKFMKFIERNEKNGILLQDMLQLLIMDFVGLAIFGIDAGVIDNPDSEFYKMGKNIFNVGVINQFFNITAPKLGEKLGIVLGKKEHVQYFCKIIKDAFEYRKKTGTQRKDFIQMMLQLQEVGKIELKKADPNDNHLTGDSVPTDAFELTDDSLMSQAYTFMTTGLDTVSVTTEYCFYELAQHPEIQSKVREEIVRQTQAHGGLTYEALKSMTYLDNIISESSRLHPIVMAIFRECTKDYEFPNGYEVKKGHLIHIPVHVVHLNPRYHPEPLEFRPERFETPVKPCTYFPFGEGPRTCIAMRFALMQVKYLLAKILMRYEVKLNKKTKLPLKLKPRTLILQSEDPLYFDLTPVK